MLFFPTAGKLADKKSTNSYVTVPSWMANALLNATSAETNG